MNTLKEVVLFLNTVFSAFTFPALLVGGLDSLSPSATRWYCFSRHLPASSAPLRHRPPGKQGLPVFFIFFKHLLVNVVEDKVLE